MSGSFYCVTKTTAHCSAFQEKLLFLERFWIINMNFQIALWSFWPLGCLWGACCSLWMCLCLLSEWVGSLKLIFPVDMDAAVQQCLGAVQSCYLYMCLFVTAISLVGLSPTPPTLEIISLIWGNVWLYINLVWSIYDKKKPPSNLGHIAKFWPFCMSLPDNP